MVLAVNLDIDTDTIRDPASALEAILASNKHLQEDVLRNDISRFIDSFKNEHIIIPKPIANRTCINEIPFGSTDSIELTTDLLDDLLLAIYILN